MKMKVQIIIEYETGEETFTHDVACLTRGDLLPETLGLTLAEGKDLLAKMQKEMIDHQVAEYIQQSQHCSNCGSKHSLKDAKYISFRTPFGKLKLDSPRFYSCNCQPRLKKSFSPLAVALPERTSPEFLYLESKWPSLMSFGLTADIINEILPIDISKSTLHYNSMKVAERLEDELDEEQWTFIEGCERDWEKLPKPDSPITVGIDGGFVHAREGDNRKAGWFEVIVGKSMKEEKDSKRFGFVKTYDEKSKRRLFETLKSQGFQFNQQITFLSDGGESVRDLQLYMSPQAEHVLDWFHVTMRITSMKQMSKRLASHEEFKNIENKLERIKWFLWHGNVFKTLKVLDDMLFDIECFEDDLEYGNLPKFAKAVREFRGYIYNNKELIPNYGDRHHYGEAISTAFVESTVNEVVSRRMVKKQQMRWSRKGAHNMLQLRTKTLNHELRDTFQRWYPGMMTSGEEINSVPQALMN
ncbi:MAG: ISKra4 family transposase [Proteobacteria bacterium]|nr:ISKra4 family transposase [Pseudomonadota bacterium]MBU1582963.1 ISKra4 family transposase [Pseudomonadota bacterium]MBU2631350.1 ISKra4 family transposase [Pseudomonadota bacterium]